MKATSAGSAVDGTRSAMIATAPFATAGATKPRPSLLVPATATNRSPGLTLRLSALTPLTSSASKRASLTASTVEQLLELHESPV